MYSYADGMADNTDQQKGKDRFKYSALPTMSNPSQHHSLSSVNNMSYQCYYRRIRDGPGAHPTIESNPEAKLSSTQHLRHFQRNDG